MRRRWTDEEDAYIKDNYKTLKCEDIAKHIERSVDATYKRAQIIGAVASARNTVYTSEMTDYLRQNIKKYTLAELRKEFNKHFNCNVSQDGINKHLQRSGIYRDLSKEEKAEILHKRSSEIGTEHIQNSRKGGRVLVKVSNDMKGYHKNFRFKHHLVWEEHMGEIPEGYCVGFLDGDKTNCDITNLVSYPNKWTAYLQWTIKGRTHRELTITALMCAQLYYKCENEFFIGQRRAEK